jgi:ribosomal protein S18 acetylase RimI-like enzyme
MSRAKVQLVDPGEEARATNVQLMAFSADPIMRWLWPEPHDYVSHFPGFVRGFGGRAFENGSAHVTEDFAGGSLWLPPGVHPDGEVLEALLKETVQEPAYSEIMTMLEQLDEAHPAAEHWHLAFLGADPSHRGKGLGASLLEHVLAQIDEQEVHCYLESSNPRNVSLYQRQGFEVVREVRVGNSPPGIPMVRPPRPVV